MKTTPIILCRRMFFLPLATLIFWLPFHLSADQLTNRVFRTTPYMNGLYPYSDNSNPGFREIFLKGTNSEYGHEILPAEEDPHGNWGPTTNGNRISIRFYQTNFVVGEPVSTVVLWRNVGERPLRLNIGFGVENYPFDFSLKLGRAVEKPLVPHLAPDWRDHYSGGPSGQFFEPGEQVRFVLRLDKIFDLTKPGAYEVTAGRDKAESGVAKFWILPKSEAHTNAPSVQRK